MLPKSVTSITAALLLTPATLLADAHNDENSVPETLGFVEWVVLEETGLRLKARLDTGAKTSSLHAVNVEPFEKDEEEWVSFQLPLADHQDQDDADGENLEEVILEFNLPVERTVKIKRKGAPSQSRYVVNMEFCIAGTTHKTEFSLTDRGKFSYPALLGRRFMSDDNILINSSDAFIAEKECEHKSLAELADKHVD
ncbi:RimK/LysX family protein [Marinobacter sp. ATCH36]|uniref:ATP-dependent zinc protease family protein n=1 Tax=Marinobacter sp. ATCH36 TaxID=2945106 RepID=UPI002020EE69|nr:RimK/LysX family protein [Marinobacter sp. ATCH36]MCL7944648.1 RimK/LysX family protein [Marinobacter sp. ATCH36]